MQGAKARTPQLPVLGRFLNSLWSERCTNFDPAILRASPNWIHTKVEVVSILVSYLKCLGLT